VTDPFAELRRWTAPTPSQRVLQQEFVAHSNSHANPASRDCLPDHLTASALVLSTDGTQVLLALHRKVQIWLQFGGHVEPEDQSLAEAALREAREESGIPQVELRSSSPVQLDRHPAPCAQQARHHLDVQFVATASPQARVVVSDESWDVQWFDVAALPTPTDDAVRRLVRAAVAQTS
jgi:8-oxo-dGTP pyrophosphatase MutT (NUDIX family)